MKVRNTFAIFLVSGFWHGANWTFIIWGALNALYIMPSIIFKTNRNNLDIVAKGKIAPTFKELFAMGTTFGLTVFAWIFFRSKNVTAAVVFIKNLFSGLLHASDYAQTLKFILSDVSHTLPLLLIAFLIMEWIGREQQYAIAQLFTERPRQFRWVFYYLIVIFILVYAGSEQQFIYFQF